MSQNQLNTPVLFLVFNRPDTTRQVFNAISQIKPKRLYIAADGPRVDRVGEHEKCLQARSILNNISWDCTVKTLFRDENVGCGKAVSSAIDWFFENVEEGIILEDDCVPVQSFFPFCEELLSVYRDDTRILHINGDNFQNGRSRGLGSYYFSRYPHSWGWATWKRAWRHFDFQMNSFSSFIDNDMPLSLFFSSRERKYWQKTFSIIYNGIMYNGRIDVWDYQWAYAVMIRNGLSITPNVNLVENIGTGLDATHTSSVGKRTISNKVGYLKEIVHPSFVVRDNIADHYTFSHYYYQRTIFGKAWDMISRVFQ